MHESVQNMVRRCCRAQGWGSLAVAGVRAGPQWGERSRPCLRPPRVGVASMVAKSWWRGGSATMTNETKARAKLGGAILALRETGV